MLCLALLCFAFALPSCMCLSKKKDNRFVSVLFINFNASSYIKTEHEICEKQKPVSANAN